jgi:hypothetical protein
MKTLRSPYSTTHALARVGQKIEGQNESTVLARPTLSRNPPLKKNRWWKEYIDFETVRRTLSR